MIIDKNDPEQRFEHMLASLRRRNCRMTSHRISLLRLISISEGHPTALDLYTQLRKQFPTASLATVYKTLVILKEEDEVFEIDLHGQSRFDGNKPAAHPHLVCIRCKHVLDGDRLRGLDGIDIQIMNLYGFEVTRQQQLFYGICPDCRKEEKSGFKN